MRICIYVPNVGDKETPDKKGSTKAVLGTIVANVCEKLGGCNVIDAIGCYKGPKGATISEPFYLVEIYSADAQAQAIARYSALVVLHQLDQATAAYTVGDTMFYVNKGTANAPI